MSGKGKAREREKERERDDWKIMAFQKDGGVQGTGLGGRCLEFGLYQEVPVRVCS